MVLADEAEVAGEAGEGRSNATPFVVFVVNLVLLALAGLIADVDASPTRLLPARPPSLAFDHR